MKVSSVVKGLIAKFNLIELSVRLKLPVMTALLARVLSNVIDTKSRYNVLCIGRPIFNEDLEEMAKHGGSLNYIVMPKGFFICIFNCFLPRLLLSHTKYHDVADCDREKQLYRKFLEAFLARLSGIARFDAIMSANYNYSWQQELALAARNRGVPFIVLYKEGISPLFADGVSPQGGYDMMVAQYTNNRFIGNKLLVYNDRIKNAFAHLSIEGIGKDTVETVGIPRFDRYFKLNFLGRKLVFFSFDFEDKARHLGLAPEAFDKYLSKTKEFHAEVMKFAAAHPHQTVVIKTKNNAKYLKYVEQIADETGCVGLANLVITNVGNVYDLIKDAYAVIGYNSTALLEAFAARRIVMTADFRWGVVRDYFDEYPDLPYYVSNSKDIAQVLTSVREGRPIDDPQLNALLYERIHVPDGFASSRAEAAIQRAIIAHPHARGSQEVVQTSAI